MLQAIVRRRRDDEVEQRSLVDYDVHLRDESTQPESRLGLLANMVEGGLGARQ